MMRNPYILFVFLLCVHKQTKLEKTVKVKMCWSIVYEMLQGVRTPERPSSPAELYVTEEQEFLSKNPKVNPPSGSNVHKAIHIFLTGHWSLFFGE